MITVLQFSSIVIYILYLYLTLARRWKYHWVRAFLAPSSLFALFSLVMWSPLAVFNLSLVPYEEVVLTDQNKILFLINYCYIFTFLIIGSSISNGIIRITSKQGSLVHPYHMPAGFRYVPIITIVLIITYLLDSGIRSHFIDVFRYIERTTVVSYNYLRREQEYGGLYSVVFSRLQYSVIFVLFCHHLWGFLTQKRIQDLILMVLIFLVGAMSLNKMPLVYFVTAASVLITVRFFRHKGKGYIVLIATTVLLTSLITIYAMYALQYRELFYQQEIDIIELISYRAFMAYPSGFKLYVAYYPDILSYTSGLHISIFRGWDDGVVVPPHLAIPQSLGYFTTSAPAGYPSDIYSAFGSFGVIFLSVGIGIYVRFADFIFDDVLERLKNDAVPYVVAFSFSLMWLWKIPAVTTIITGGVGVTLVILLYILKFSYRVKTSR